MNKRTQGSLAEEAVSSVYSSSGYTILEKNWYCGRTGEVDLIAAKEGMLVFVEVKCRNSSCSYSPSESVNIPKRNRIRKAAKKYLSDYSFMRGTERFPFVRFDVAEVRETDTAYRINVIKNAF